MALACPACRKLNEFFDSTSSPCTQCGCDLSRLRAVGLAAAQSQNAAAISLRFRDWPGALKHAERSWSLLNTTQAARLAALAGAALGQSEALLVWRRRAGDARHEPESVGT